MNGCVHRTDDNICKYYSHGDIRSWCDLENGCDSVVPSNYDRIHSFTAEQLAMAIANMDCFQDACPCDTEICKHFPHGCYVAWLEWLKQEAKDERTV